MCITQSWFFLFFEFLFLILLSVSLAAPAFTIAPKASPSTAHKVPRLSEDPSNNRHTSLITVIIICVGALIGVLLIVLTICFCTFRKGKKKVPHAETRTYLTIHCVIFLEPIYIWCVH